MEEESKWKMKIVSYDIRAVIFQQNQINHFVPSFAIFYSWAKFQ